MRRRILSGDRDAISHCAHAVVAAGLTAGPRYHDRRIRMVRKGRAKCRRGMAIVAFYGNAWMPRWTGVGAGTNRDNAVVARRTRCGNRRVVESSIRGKCDETGGRVANAAFCRGNEVNRRFSNGNDAIMTTAACAEYLGVINKVRHSEALGRMTSLAHITCRNMGARFARKCWVHT